MRFKEKCIICNGGGTEQSFDRSINQWVKSSIACKYCNGLKHRYYKTETRNKSFLFIKTYQ